MVCTLFIPLPCIYAKQYLNRPIRRISLSFSHNSDPTPASEAKPYAAAKLKDEKATWDITRVHGQQLMGDMIPKIEDTVHPDEENNEETAEDTEKKPLLANGKKPVYSQ